MIVNAVAKMIGPAYGTWLSNASLKSSTLARAKYSIAHPSCRALCQMTCRPGFRTHSAARSAERYCAALGVRSQVAYFAEAFLRLLRQHPTLTRRRGRRWQRLTRSGRHQVLQGGAQVVPADCDSKERPKLGGERVPGDGIGA
eukprot:1567049-Prymnesium_polylepis.1